MGRLLDFDLQSNLKNKQKGKKMNYSIDISSSMTAPQTLDKSQQLTPPPVKIMTKRQIKSTKKSKVKISSFSWNKAEERKYISFLKNHSNLFKLTPKQRKQIKINVMMSYAIKSRTSSQCHSHHQKLIKKYDSIQGIIENHCLIYSRQQKERVEATTSMLQESLSVEPSQDNSQSPFESFLSLEDKKQEEPLWWAYTDLREQNDEAQWSLFDFLSQ